MAGSPERLSMSVFDAMFKEIYPGLRIESMAKKNRPALNYFSRDPNFYGDAYIVPVLYEDPQGRSANISDAINNAETSKQVKFVITERKSDYGVVKMNAEAMKAASKNMGSFIDAKQAQMDGKIRNLGKSLHLALFRSGSGSIGQIATSGISADDPNAGESTITLTNKSDVHNFGVGQVIVANNTDDDTSVKDDGSNPVKVKSRDVSAGKIVVDKDVSNDLSSAWADDDYLFTEGDPDAKVTGLAGWLPLTAPSDGESFFSVDRSVDATRLAGQRVDNSGRSIMENAQELAMLIGEEGGDPDTLFLNPRAGMQLLAEVGSEVSRGPGGTARSGHRGFTIENFISGPLDVVFDMACPENRGYMLQKDTWKLAHLGGLPHIVQEDGLIMLRESGSDSYEVRFRYWAELTCHAPGFNGVMSVATA